MAEPNPNVQILGIPNNAYSMDNRTAYGNGVAGSVAPMTVYISETRKSTATANYWSKFMREGDSSPICFEKRPGGNKGGIVKIRIQGTLGGPGRRGDDLFTARSQMGKIPLAEMSITLDMISQGTGVSPFAEEIVGTGGQVEADLPNQMGKWGGRKVCQDIDMTILHRGSGYSRAFAGNKTSHATLVSADVPTYNMIRDFGQVMRNQGGFPFRAGMQANGEPLWAMGWFLPDPLKNAIKADTNYQAILQNAGIRGNENPYFTGIIPTIDGNIIMGRITPVEQGQVKTGTPFAPIAFLGVADPFVSAGTNTVLQGGGLLYNASTDTPWFDDFPGNQYVFGQTDTLTLASSFWGSGPYYALVVNPKNAATDPGKIGMIAYTISAGANTLTVTSRLSSSVTTAINDTTVGSVAYGGVINSSNFTADYAVGAAIIPCNALGCPIGAAPALGANAIGFVRGGQWGELYKQRVQGGLSGEELFAGWTYGQTPYTTINGFTPGVLCVGCAVSYPQYSLPTVT